MPRILVVEDSSSMRAFVRSALETAPAGTFSDPMRVVEASSGFDALRLLPRGPYDLVVTDINMPDINGLELLNFVRASEQHQNTPVILISTMGTDRDRERGMQLGAADYLIKPFTADELVKMVAERLRRAG